MNSERFDLLVNLPPDFFTEATLEPIWAQLDAIAQVRRSSCDTAEEILPHLRNADAVLMWAWPQLTDEMLDQCPRLRFSANIDIVQAAAKTFFARGIPISASRRGFSPAVSEMALALMLAALRRTSNHHVAMWQGRETWVRPYPTGVDPDERQLSGRRVGIVGFGGVGQRLGELLAPFRCDLAIHDPFLPAAVSEKFGVKNMGLDELVAHAEVLVLCAAANSGSAHLLTARHIEALQPRSILVNVARASLVDNEALLARLQRGDLYAALDVFDREPLPLDSPLRALPNAYLTPHRAGGVTESTVRIVQYLADDLQAWHRGQERRHAVNEAMIATLDG